LELIGFANKSAGLLVCGNGIAAMENGFWDLSRQEIILSTQDKF